VREHEVRHFKVTADDGGSTHIFCTERTALQLAENLAGDFGLSFSVWHDGVMVRAVRSVEVDA